MSNHEITESPLKPIRVKMGTTELLTRPLANSPAIVLDLSSLTVACRFVSTEHAKRYSETLLNFAENGLQGLSVYRNLELDSYIFTFTKRSWEIHSLILSFAGNEGSFFTGQTYLYNLAYDAERELSFTVGGKTFRVFAATLTEAVNSLAKQAKGHFKLFNYK